MFKPGTAQGLLEMKQNLTKIIQGGSMHKFHEECGDVTCMHQKILSTIVLLGFTAKLGSLTNQERSPYSKDFFSQTNLFSLCDVRGKKFAINRRQKNKHKANQAFKLEREQFCIFGSRICFKVFSCATAFRGSTSEVEVSFSNKNFSLRLLKYDN